MTRRWLCTLARVAPWLCLLACGGEPNKPPIDVEIGIPDKETRRMFVPLAEGGDIYFFKGLQVEEFVMLAIRLRQSQPEAYVEVTVDDLDHGTQVVREAVELPDPLDCSDDGWCTLAPVLLSARAFADLSELDGAHLRVHCMAWRDDGAHGEATKEGILRPQPP